MQPANDTCWRIARFSSAAHGREQPLKPIGRMLMVWTVTCAARAWTLAPSEATRPSRLAYSIALRRSSTSRPIASRSQDSLRPRLTA
jgi:hypothetical protein